MNWWNKSIFLNAGTNSDFWVDVVKKIGMVF